MSGLEDVEAGEMGETQSQGPSQPDICGLAFESQQSRPDRNVCSNNPLIILPAQQLASSVS